MANSFLGPLTYENCLAWNLLIQLYVKWILKPSSQASSDLSKMALLWVALSLYVFFLHNLICISSIGTFPTWSFFSLRSGATLPLFATFFLSSSFQTLISSLLRVRLRFRFSASERFRVALLSA